MSFRNFDNYYQDYDYDSDPSPSPPFRRSGSPFPAKSLTRRATSSSPRSTRPAIGENGWEVLPHELLDPSNWGLYPSSLDSNPEDSPTHQPADQEPKMYPGRSSRMFPGRSGGIMQFYPDHDPDLINTNQLDGMPYVLQPSNISSIMNAAPKVVVNAGYNSSSFHPGKLSFSQRWEQSLLEMAHSNPETLRNYFRIPPGKRGGLKSFGELHGDDEGGQGGMRSSGGTVPGPNFGAFGISRGRGQAPASTSGYSSAGPGQPLNSGGCGGSTTGYTSGGPGQPLSGPSLGGSSRGRGRGNALPTLHEFPRTLGGSYGSAASSRAAARDAALRRDAATKVEQIRNKAEIKREACMKEIRQSEMTAAKKVKLKGQEAQKERVKQEKVERDRKARSRKERERGQKSQDVRSLAAEAAARRDVATKDIQKERGEFQRVRHEKEKREKEERARARAAKRREEEEGEEEGKYRLAMENRQRDVVAREVKARNVEVNFKDVRQLVREAAERRFAAIERERQVEERSKNSPAPKKDETAQPLVCADCAKRFASESQASAHADKSGHQNYAEVKLGSGKSAVKPSPAPALVKEAAPAPQATLAKTAAEVPEKKTLPSRPAPAKATAKAALLPPASPIESDEEKLTPRERVKLAMARREAAIRALPAEEQEVVRRPLLMHPKRLTKGNAKTLPVMSAAAKAKPEAQAQREAKLKVDEERAERRRMAAAQAEGATELEEKAGKFACLGVI